MSRQGRLVGVCAAALLATGAGSPEEVDLLIRRLGGASHDEREAAQRALAEMGEDAVEALSRWQDAEDLEVRARVRELIGPVREARLRKDLAPLAIEVRARPGDGSDCGVVLKNVGDRPIVVHATVGVDVCDAATGEVVLRTRASASRPAQKIRKLGGRCGLCDDEKDLFRILQPGDQIRLPVILARTALKGAAPSPLLEKPGRYVLKAAYASSPGACRDLEGCSADHRDPARLWNRALEGVKEAAPVEIEIDP